MLAEVRVGLVQAQDGAVNPARSGRFGELITGEAVGRYYELSRQGRLFMASMQAGAALGTALTATAVTFTLYNPTGSGVNLSLLQCAVALTALQVTTTTVEDLVYAANDDPTLAIPATVTQITTRSALLGAFKSQGRAYSAATLPATPVVIRSFPLATQNTVTTQLAQPNLAFVDNIDGAIALAPNTAVTIQGLATTTGITGIVGMLWAEIPV